MTDFINQIEPWIDNEELVQLKRVVDSTFVTESKLTKEFETLGFYISDHPLNQYKPIFNQYNVISFENFESFEIFSGFFVDF